MTVKKSGVCHLGICYNYSKSTEGIIEKFFIHILQLEYQRKNNQQHVYAWMNELLEKRNLSNQDYQQNNFLEKEIFTGSRLPTKRFAPTSKLFLSWEAWNKKKKRKKEVNSSINYAENSPAHRWTWLQLVCAELQRRILKVQVFDMYWWKWNHTHLIYPDWLPIYFNHVQNLNSLQHSHHQLNQLLQIKSNDMMNIENQLALHRNFDTYIISIFLTTELHKSISLV